MALTQARSSSVGSVRSTHTGSAFSRSARLSIGTWLSRPFCNTKTLIMRALSRMWGYRDVLALAPKMKTAQVYPQRPFHDHPRQRFFTEKVRRCTKGDD